MSSLLDHLHYDLLSNILSYNNYPYCNGVCRYLTKTEDHLYMDRYRRIIGRKEKGWFRQMMRNIVINSDWESLRFVFSYIWLDGCIYDYQDSCSHLETISRSGRDDIVLYMLDELDVPIVDVDEEDEDRYDDLKSLLRVCSREVAIRISKRSGNYILEMKAAYCVVDNDIDEVIYYMTEAEISPTTVISMVVDLSYQECVITGLTNLLLFLYKKDGKTYSGVLSQKVLKEVKERSEEYRNICKIEKERFSRVQGIGERYKIRSRPPSRLNDVLADSGDDDFFDL
jgi:hypothetical protein